MSADELRQAAATLRERANAAPAGDHWYVEHGQVWVAHDDGGNSSSALTHAFPIWADGAPEYIATMQTGVGLALADWLDEVWGWREEGLGLMPDGNLADAWGCIERQALIVARLINGGAS